MRIISLKSVMLREESNDSLELKNEMIKSIKDHFKGLADVESDDFKFDVEAAIYYFSEQYHEGQWSNLYSILSQSEYNPGRLETFDSWKESNTIGSEIYDFLKSEYSGDDSDDSDETQIPDSSGEYTPRDEAPEHFTKQHENIIKLTSLKTIIKEEISKALNELSPEKYDQIADDANKFNK
jgi:hypothetical protein